MPVNPIQDVKTELVHTHAGVNLANNLLEQHAHVETYFRKWALCKQKEKRLSLFPVSYHNKKCLDKLPLPSLTGKDIPRYIYMQDMPVQ